MNTLFLTALEDYPGNTMSSNLESMLGAFMGVFAVFAVILVLTYLASWKIFTKAGYAGWKCLIPFYNQYVLCQISFGIDKGWYFIFGFIPVVSYVFPFVLEYKLCQAFQKGIGFTILAMFFSPITRLIIGFGDSEHINKPRY